MIDWQKYKDEFNLVKGLQGDGGDSLQRFGTISTLFMWLDNLRDWRGWGLYKGYAHDLAKFRCYANGKYKRHPDKRHWYGDCDRMSRDQATPLVVSLGVFGNKKLLWEFLWAHIKRLGFMTNTRNNGATKLNHGTLYKVEADGTRIYWNYNWKLPDFTGPEFWGLYIRGFNAWFLYPLLLLADLETLTGAIKRRYEGLGVDDDVLNHMIISEYSFRKFPTPISWLTKKVNDNDELLKKLEVYCLRVGLPLDVLWRELLTEGK